MATVAVVFGFSNKMAELEIEKKFKNSKKMLQTKKLFLRGRHVLYTSKTTGSDQMQQSLHSHLMLRKNNFLASYYIQITAWRFLRGIWHKYYS